jgi:hypothetical protein
MPAARFLCRRHRCGGLALPEDSWASRAVDRTYPPSTYKARKQFSDSSKTSMKYQNAPDRFSLTLELQQRIATTPPSPIATSPASLAGGRPQQQQRTSPATGSQHQQPFTEVVILQFYCSPSSRCRCLVLQFRQFRQSVLVLANKALAA